MVAVIAFSVLIVLMLVNVPISFAMCAAAASALLYSGVNIATLAQRMFYGLDTFTLLSVPLFMLAGRLMAVGGVTRDLLNLSRAFVGHLRGGLAYVNIVASMVFAGITGTAAADSASLGSILIPAMEQEGFDKDFSVAVTATSSTIGIMIPPSIPMIIYGVSANASIGRLFMGGVIPGILVGGSLMGVTFIMSKKRGYPVDCMMTMQERAFICLKGIPALMTVVIIIGGITTGFFTATEAACIACVYSLLLGMFYYRELHIRDLPKILQETAVSTGVVALMIASASALGWIFAQQQIPAKMSAALLSLTDNKYLLLLLINVLLLFVGTWLDMTPAIILFTPILLPIITALGINTVHFGVMMVVNLAIGLFTPPVGVCLFLTCGIAKCSINDVVKGFIPFFVITLVDLLLITYIPAFSTWLPTMIYG